VVIQFDKQILNYLFRKLLLFRKKRLLVLFSHLIDISWVEIGQEDAIKFLIVCEINELILQFLCVDTGVIEVLE